MNAPAPRKGFSADGAGAGGRARSGYVKDMTSLAPRSETQDYTLPEGCPVCGADLPVRVSAAGPRGACPTCHWMGRPLLTVTHGGLRVSVEPERA